MALTDVAAVKAMLRWGQGAETKYEAQLPGYIAAAEAIIEAQYGPFAQATVTLTVNGGSTIALPTRLNTITSVTVDGVPVIGWTFDPNSSILYGAFTTGRLNTVVVGTVGYADEDMPAAVKFAATSLAVHLWSVASQRGPGLPEDYTAYPTGFLVPNVVKQALEPYQTIPGFA